MAEHNNWQSAELQFCKHAPTQRTALQVVDNHGVPIRESADPELQRSLELQAGPARSRLSLEGVPLERQISVKFPTIITPSAEAEQLRIDIPGISAQEAAQHYVGKLGVYWLGFA